MKASEIGVKSLTGSYDSFVKTDGLIASGPLDAMPSV